MDRGYSYYGEVRLGHSFIPAILDYILDNGPHLSPWTFCPLGRLVPWDVLSLGTFCLCTLGIFPEFIILIYY